MTSKQKTILGFTLIGCLLLSPLAIEAMTPDAGVDRPDLAPLADQGADAPLDTSVMVDSTTDAEIVAEPTISELVTDVQSVVNDWKSLGVLAGLIAILQLLMKILKFAPINAYMAKKKIKWIKPYITTSLGALLGGLTAYASDGVIINSVMAGIMVGMASTGWNEILNKRQRKKRQQ